MNQIYLLHFSQKLAGHAGHYLGWTDELSKRLHHHRRGTGARITAALRRNGGTFKLARTWDGDRNLERKLKNQKKLADLCPICRKKAILKPRKIMKHWTRFLPNVGGHTLRLSDRQENTLSRIETLRAQIKREQRSYREEEKSIEQYVGTGREPWTAEEIAEAKAAAANQKKA